MGGEALDETLDECFKVNISISSLLADAAECYEECGEHARAVQRYSTALEHPDLEAPSDVVLRLAALAAAGGDDNSQEVCFLKLPCTLILPFYFCS